MAAQRNIHQAFKKEKNKTIKGSKDLRPLAGSGAASRLNSYVLFHRRGYDFYGDRPHVLILVLCNCSVHALAFANER